jgi:hypothetical protein
MNRVITSVKALFAIGRASLTLTAAFAGQPDGVPTTAG